jgi:hypothetical protein
MKGMLSIVNCYNPVFRPTLSVFNNCHNLLYERSVRREQATVVHHSNTLHSLRDQSEKATARNRDIMLFCLATWSLASREEYKGH